MRFDHLEYDIPRRARPKLSTIWWLTHLLRLEGRVSILSGFDLGSFVRRFQLTHQGQSSRFLSAVVGQAAIFQSELSRQRYPNG